MVKVVCSDVQKKKKKKNECVTTNIERIAPKSVRPVLAHNLVFLVSSVKQQKKKQFLLYEPLNTH